MNTINTSYKVLGIPESSTQSQLKSAYRRLAMNYHPDKINYSSEIIHHQNNFIQIQEAYHNIVEERKRQKQIGDYLKGFYAQKFADIFENETNDIDEQQQYFAKRHQVMEQKLSSIEQTLKRWKRSRQKYTNINTRVEQPTSPKRRMMSFFEEQSGFMDFMPNMQQINQRIKNNIKIFKIVTEQHL